MHEPSLPSASPEAAPHWLRGAKRVYPLIALTCTLLYIVLMIVVVIGWSSGQDRALALAVHDRLGLSTFPFFTAVSTFGDGVTRTVCVVLVAAVLLYFRLWWSIVLLVAGTGGSALLNLALKAVVHRPRPALFPGAMHIPGDSFPSGHAMNSLVFFGVLVYLISHLTRRRDLKVLIAIVPALLTALIALSRIVLGVHYPSDVLGGILAGAAYLALLLALMQEPLERESLAHVRAGLRTIGATNQVA